MDYIVSEPFMGPFLKKLPTTQDAKKTIKKLEPMYNAVLKEILKISKNLSAVCSRGYLNLQITGLTVYCEINLQIVFELI